MGIKNIIINYLWSNGLSLSKYVASAWSDKYGNLIVYKAMSDIVGKTATYCILVKTNPEYTILRQGKN